MTKIILCAIFSKLIKIRLFFFLVLTDDGRTMTEEEARPKCPICDETFDVDDVKTLEMHVEAHLATNLYCPVCNASFGIDKRQDYQNHVQVKTEYIPKKVPKLCLKLLMMKHSEIVSFFHLHIPLYGS